MVLSAAAGDMHSAACTASGVVYTWGFGATGALGHGMGNESGGNDSGLSNQTTPKRVDAFLTHFRDFVEVVQVECGAYHTLALSKAATVTTTRKRRRKRRQKDNKNQRKGHSKDDDDDAADDEEEVSEEDEVVEVVKPGLVYAFGDGESGALGLGADRGEAATHRSVLPQLVRIPKKPQQQQRGGATLLKSPNDGLMNTSRDIVDGDDHDKDDDDDDDDESGGLASIRSIAAGHLTSGAVDSDGRLFVWGCPFAEDGVNPTDADLVPHESTVAARNDVEMTTITTKHKKMGTRSSGGGGIGGGDEDGSLGCVRFRSVGMGGYHAVAATEVHDRWGRPFDQQFAGLPHGLVLPAAKHTRPAARTKQRLSNNTMGNNTTGADSTYSSFSSSGGSRKDGEDGMKAFRGAGMVGKLRVAPSSTRGNTAYASSRGGDKEQADADADAWNNEQPQVPAHRSLFISVGISDSSKKKRGEKLA